MSIRLILLFSVICYLPPVTAIESILKFYSEITLTQNATLQVIETITIKAEGIKIKHGVYRYFPTDYKDRSGNRYHIGFKVLEILRDGRSEPYRLKKQNNGVRIFFGDKDRYLEPGTYTYTLRYETNRQLGFFSDHDKFYWNVTGNKWLFPIQEVTATIHLPQSIPNDSITLKGYTRKSGLEGENNVSYTLEGHSAVFESTLPLSPNSGLAISITWPKKFVTVPDNARKLQYFLEENPESLIAMAGMVIILSYYLLVWYRLRKYSNKSQAIPLNQVPTGFSPASMRFIQRKKYDYKTFTAAMINLAVKGHLHIEEGTSGKFVLNKKPSSTSLAPGEKTILKHLFAADSQFIELKTSNHKQLQKALDAHHKSLQLNAEKIYFLNNSAYLVPGFLLSIILLVTIFFTVPVSDKTALNLISPILLMIWTTMVLSLMVSAYKAWKNFCFQHSIVHLVSAKIKTIIVLALAIAEIFALKVLALESSMTIAISLPILVLINFSAYRRLKTPTFSGRKLMDKLVSFKLFLEVAEKEYSYLIQTNRKTAQLFEQLLPYAFALDVEQQWSIKFAPTFETAMSSKYKPRWYNSSHYQHTKFTSFVSSIGNKLTSAIISSSTAPTSL